MPPLRRYSCSECGYVARDNHQLNVHRRTHVPRHLKCRFCKSPHHTEEEVKLHEEVCRNCVTCFHCRKKVRDRFTLRAHIKNKHSAPKRPGSLLCPLCSHRFSNIDSIETHFSENHKTSLEKTDLAFDNELDFYQWKADMETSSQSAFTKKSNNIRPGKKYAYFSCHRSGSDKMKLECRKRRPKLIGSNKINAYCPARISVRVDNDGKVYATYVATHVGHDFEVTRLRLSPSYRESLAVKMKMKMPLDEIMKFEREEAKERSRNHLDRSMFLKRHDLHNIARDFGVRSDIVFHSEDLTSGGRRCRNMHRESGSPNSKRKRDGSLVRFCQSTNAETDVAAEHCQQQIVCDEYNREFYGTVVIESPNDEFVWEDTELPRDIQSRPLFIRQKEELVLKFAEIAKTFTSDEELAIAEEAISSLALSLSALRSSGVGRIGHLS